MSQGKAPFTQLGVQLYKRSVVTDEFDSDFTLILHKLCTLKKKCRVTEKHTKR